MEFDPTTVDGWSALNERQQKFCMAYLADGNGRAAAIAAGYSEKCAEVTASKLKHDKKVAAVLDALRRARFAQDALSLEEAQSILAGIARGRLGKFLRSGGSVDIEAIRQGGLRKRTRPACRILFGNAASPRTLHPQRPDVIHILMRDVMCFTVIMIWISISFC